MHNKAYVKSKRNLLIFTFTKVYMEYQFSSQIPDNYFVFIKYITNMYTINNWIGGGSSIDH